MSDKNSELALRALAVGESVPFSEVPNFVTDIGNVVCMVKVDGVRDLERREFEARDGRWWRII